MKKKKKIFSYLSQVGRQVQIRLKEIASSCCSFKFQSLVIYQFLFKSVAEFDKQAMT